MKSPPSPDVQGSEGEFIRYITPARNVAPSPCPPLRSKCVPAPGLKVAGVRQRSRQKITLADDGGSIDHTLHATNRFGNYRRRWSSQGAVPMSAWSASRTPLFWNFSTTVPCNSCSFYWHRLPLSSLSPFSSLPSSPDSPPFRTASLALLPCLRVCLLHPLRHHLPLSSSWRIFSFVLW